MHEKEEIIKARKFFEFDKFCIKVFDDSINSFQKNKTSLGLSNLACNLREIFRIMLEHWAPDNEVRKCPWCQGSYLDKNKKPTRKAKIRYYLLNIMEDNIVEQIFRDSTKSYEDKYIEYIDNLSKYTHITEKTYDITLDEINIKFYEFIDLICDIENFLVAAKSMTNESIEKFLYSDIRKKVYGNLPDELDALSTHTSVQDMNQIDFNIEKIADGFINISGVVQLDTNLRYGSDSDFRHDDGLEFPMSFEMGFHVRVDIADFSIKEYEYDEINTDSFYK